ncbi:MAG: hypothetical protein AAF404_10220 [Pseudomonadota bacterium]
MTISTDAEYQAAQDLFRKYGFRPGISKNHPLQASLDILATAVDNYAFLSKDLKKAA